MHENSTSLTSCYVIIKWKTIGRKACELLCYIIVNKLCSYKLKMLLKLMSHANRSLNHLADSQIIIWHFCWMFLFISLIFCLSFISRFNWLSAMCQSTYAWCPKNYLNIISNRALICVIVNSVLVVFVLKCEIIQLHPYQFTKLIYGNVKEIQLCYMILILFLSKSYCT